MCKCASEFLHLLQLLSQLSQCGTGGLVQCIFASFRSNAVRVPIVLRPQGLVARAQFRIPLYELSQHRLLRRRYSLLSALFKTTQQSCFQVGIFVHRTLQVDFGQYWLFQDFYEFFKYTEKVFDVFDFGWTGRTDEFHFGGFLED